MIEDDPWPVVFIGRDDSEKVLIEAVKRGEVKAAMMSRGHARRGARCLLLSQSGGIYAVGNLADARDPIYRFTWEAKTLIRPAALSRHWLEMLLALPQPWLVNPLNAFVLSNSFGKYLDDRWFQSAEKFALSKLPLADRLEPGLITDDVGDWLPPALRRLLAEVVPANEWEIVVSKAFIALGCTVEVLGHERPGQPEPDCIARYTSPMGQVVEFVVDAKAGRWGGAVDDLRAMRDYHASANPYTIPLFVVGQVAPGTQDRLRQYPMHGRPPGLLTGEQLALLITQRITQPGFELRQAIMQAIRFV